MENGDGVGYVELPRGEPERESSTLKPAHLLYVLVDEPNKPRVYTNLDDWEHALMACLPADATAMQRFALRTFCRVKREHAIEQAEGCGFLVVPHSVSTLFRHHIAACQQEIRFHCIR